MLTKLSGTRILSWISLGSWDNNVKIRRLQDRNEALLEARKEWTAAFIQLKSLRCSATYIEQKLLDARLDVTQQSLLKEGSRYS